MIEEGQGDLKELCDLLLMALTVAVVNIIGPNGHNKSIANIFSG